MGAQVKPKHQGTPEGKQIAKGNTNTNDRSFQHNIDGSPVNSNGNTAYASRSNKESSDVLAEEGGCKQSI